MSEKFGLFCTVALKFCPALAFIFSIIVNFMTLYISQNISPIFIFITIQVYLNWYSILKTSTNATTIGASTTTTTRSSSSSVTIEMKNKQPTSKLQYWYCDKCLTYTCQPSKHCRACKKCYHNRNHHCFFIGTCIIRRNMGNFILICLYTSMACLYSLIIIGPCIYKHLTNTDFDIYQVLLNFSFPIVFAKFFVNGDINYLLLVTVFDLLFTIFIICFGYGIWKLFCCLTGKQKYYPHDKQQPHNVYEIFGNYGLWNFIFPFNGLVGFNNNKKYPLKDI